MDDQFLTFKDAAQYAGVNYQKIRRLVLAGELTAYVAGVRRQPLMVKKSELDELLKPRPVEIAKHTS